jgi:signal transduction histidine kinase
MTRLTDHELIGELEARMEENRKALHDLKTVSHSLGMMNRKLKESEALKSNFLSNIRNEINNPLTAILGLSKALAERLDGSGEAAVMADLIYAEAFNFHFQLRNILTAAALEAGEAAPNHVRIDMCHLAQITVDSFAHLTRNKGLEVSLACDDRSGGNLHRLYCDAEKIQSIMANLLANAVEFSPERGMVKIVLSCRDDELRLTVRDHGPGIPARKREVIFDRFRQLDTGMSRAHRGHGIGLSITRELVDILGGTIAVSGARGGGALFTVKLPVPAKPDTESFYADSGNAFIFDTGPDGAELLTETI